MEFTELFPEQFIIRLNKVLKKYGLRTDITSIVMRVERFDDSNVDRLLEYSIVTYEIKVDCNGIRILPDDIISRVWEIITDNYEYLGFYDDCRVSNVKVVKGFIWGIDAK